MKVFFTSALIVAIGIQPIFSQDFSNKGKDFYLCFPNHVPSTASTLATLSIWITSDRASSGTITMGNGAFTSSFNIPANGLQEIQVPHSLAHISNAESGTVVRKSIRILVDPGKPPVVAYAQQWGQARSAATLLLPVSVLGKKYRAISFTQNGVDGPGGAQARSQFQIIAVKPNTQVRITPMQNGVAGTPFIVNMPLAGDVYQYQAQQDISGTLIESVVAAGSSSCLPIAVFSGSSNITLGTNLGCNGASYDPFFQQNYPISSWGKNFGLIPFDDYPVGIPYRVLASEDNTILTVNGTQVATLNAGQIYPTAFTSNPSVVSDPVSITANKPICVAEYAQSRDCGGGGFGDPDMVILNPIEQNIKDITIFSSTQENINRQWINVLIKTAGVASFRINGAPPSGTWQSFTPLPGFSYLRQMLPGEGSYRLVSDSGFNAIAYGFANSHESYAYSAGTYIKDLYQQAGVSNIYATEQANTVCTGSPFRFKLSLPYLADSIRWNLSQIPGAPVPSTFTTRYPVPATGFDSSSVINGKTVYWYSLPVNFNFNSVGVFQVTLTAYAPSVEGCGTEQEILLDLDISEPPVAAFNFTSPVCVAETVQFTDVTSTVKPKYLWYWNFDDPGSGTSNLSASQHPSHVFSTPGVHNIKFSTITTAGCISDTISVPVTVPAMPTASITSTAGTITNVCQNAASPTITFTGSGGVAPYTFTYTLNGGPAQTVNSTGSSSSAILSVPTTVVGTFTYRLTRVQNVGSTLCFQNQTGTATINVLPLPNASIAASTNSVCLNTTAPAAPVITFSATGSTAPYTFTYHINGGANQTIVSNAAGIATITVPTNVAGIFAYNLLNVRDAGTNLCQRSITGQSQIITIRPLPMATIAGTTTVCQNSAQPSITFTGSGGAPPYVFTYKIGATGALQTVTSTGNTATVLASTSTVGTFQYFLVGASDISANACTQPQTGSATITVKALPTASVSGTTTVCLNNGTPTITFAGSSTAPPYLFSYNINGGATQTISSTGNTATVSVPTNTAGTFSYNLLSVSDPAPNACSNVQTGQATVIVKQLPIATLSGATTVCQNDAAPQLTLTGSAGTPPYRFTYNINGGPTQTVATSGASNVVTINVPTASAGTFVYNILSITEGSSEACNQSFSNLNANFTVRPLPTASISGTASVCRNAPRPVVTFTGAIGTAPYTFTYNINGGPAQTIVSSGNTATIQAPTNVDGVFTYELISVKDASSTLCTQLQSGTAVITVWKLPEPDFSWSSISCESVPVAFNSAGSVSHAASITNYAWNFNDPGSGASNTSALQHPQHSFALPQTYNVSLTITNSNGCVSSAKTIPVKVNRNPNPGFIVPEVCLLDPNATFTDTSSALAPDAVSAWLWNFGDAASTVSNPNNSSVQHASHIYTSVGPYDVTLTAITDKGCRKNITQQLYINDGNPLANVIALNNVTNVCSVDSAAIQNKSTIASGTITRLQIYWDNLGEPSVFEIDETPSFNKIYKHKYSEFGTPASKTYVVRVVAYSGQTCSTDKTVTLTLHAQPNIQFDNIPSVCLEDDNFQLTQAVETTGIAAGGSGGFYSGSGVITSSGMYAPQTAGVGTHIIRYDFTTVAGCKDSAFSSITVHPMPSVDAGNDAVVLEGGVLQLSPVVSGSNLQFLWQNNRDLDATNIYLSSNTTSNPVAKPTEDITYRLTVTGIGGCASWDTLYVKVLKVPNIPNTFTPNGDGINDFWVIKYLDTYPECKVSVFTRAGQKVFESRGYKRPWNGTANGKTLPMDTYYYIIEPESGRKPVTGYVTIVK